MSSTLQTRAARYGTSQCRPSESDLAAYEAELSAMDEAAFVHECGQMIYMSAFASNNPRAIWHWKVDACYTDAIRRGGKDAPLYNRAYKRVAHENGMPA